MALIKCEECGKEISDKAEICVNCGCPIQKTIKEEKNKYKKHYNELSKQEKKVVSQQAVKDTTYIMFNVFIIILIIFDIVLFPSLLSFFINIPILIIQAIVDKILIKKYYNENICFADVEEKIKIQELNINNNKGYVEKKEKQDATNYDILIMIVLIALTIFTFLKIKARFVYFDFNWIATDKYGYILPKNHNLNNLIYNVAKITNYLIPCLELWLVFIYKKTHKNIFKSLTKYIGITSIILLTIFFVYAEYKIKLYSNEFVLYSIIITIMCFLLVSNKIILFETRKDKKKEQKLNSKNKIVKVIFILSLSLLVITILIFIGIKRHNEKIVYGKYEFLNFNYENGYYEKQSIDLNSKQRCYYISTINNNNDNGSIVNYYQCTWKKENNFIVAELYDRYDYTYEKVIDKIKFSYDNSFDNLYEIKENGTNKQYKKIK